MTFDSSAGNAVTPHDGQIGARPSVSSVQSLTFDVVRSGDDGHLLVDAALRLVLAGPAAGTGVVGSVGSWVQGWQPIDR